MQTKFQKGSKEWNMFTDYWSMCQKFWITEDNNEYWDSLVEDSGSFYRKYKDVPLASKLVLSFVQTIEDEDNAKRTKSRDTKLRVLLNMVQEELNQNKSYI